MTDEDDLDYDLAELVEQELHEIHHYGCAMYKAHPDGSREFIPRSKWDLNYNHTEEIYTPLTYKGE